MEMLRFDLESSELFDGKLDSDEIAVVLRLRVHGITLQQLLLF